MWWVNAAPISYCTWLKLALADPLALLCDVHSGHI
jgi:hypothetical protein